MLDGEACVLDDLGRSDFDRLQDRARRRRWYVGCEPVAYCVFDLLVENGRNVMGLPLEDRKARLATLLEGALPPILYVDHFDEAVSVFRRFVYPLKLEGLVAKRRDSIYVSGQRTKAKA